MAIPADATAAPSAKAGLPGAPAGSTPAQAEAAAAASSVPDVPGIGSASRKAMRLGILAAFLAYASWGLLSPVGKWLLDHDAYGPLGLNAVRFTLATATVWAVMGGKARREAWRLMLRRDVLWFNLLANISLSLFLYSLVTLPAAYATLGFYTAPLWTAVWAWMRLGERVGSWFLPAACGLLAGGYLTLFGAGGSTAGAVSTPGLLLAIGSGLVWAFYTVSLRRSAPAVDLKALMGASFLLGAIYFDVLALAFEPRRALDVLHQSSASWGWMAVYVAVPTLASFILFNAALQRAPAGSVNLLVGAELGFTVLFSALLFGVSYSKEQVTGLVLVLVAVTAYLWLRSNDHKHVSQEPPTASP